MDCDMGFQGIRFYFMWLEMQAPDLRPRPAQLSLTYVQYLDAFYKQTVALVAISKVPAQTAPAASALEPEYTSVEGPLPDHW